MRCKTFYLAIALAVYLIGNSCSHETVNKSCFLKGHWMNELGSNLEIKQVTDCGQIFGSYVSKVGTSMHLQNYTGSVSGWQQMKEMPTFGIVVNWHKTDSTTAWVGQCFLNQSGGEVLETLWLLRSKATSQSDNWSKTLVGSDFFYRIK
ncbi:avidin-like [Latimeria chalumnae]|uniref:avidin-like n=1 Tax=Latimeria chalumnae TaxID=7897 RepID=UPI00313AA885